MIVIFGRLWSADAKSGYDGFQFTDLWHQRDLDMANLTKCWESTDIGGVALDDIRAYQATNS
jgi:hypothetical protein